MLPRPSERRHKLQEEKELQITSFLNLMVILIPFLLVTAVFSRLAVLEISLPTPSASPDQTPPAQKLGLVILIFRESVEVVAGGKKVATVSHPVKDGEWAPLSETLKNLKK
ncbi:MAG: biopolymer transporter ExbD, partial [Nitrospirae bacterium]|nr:biopolymer transporter ExbD [Nitrospirota bacterium]